MDVKTTFSTLNKHLINTPVGHYSGPKNKGIKYALVELFSDGLCVSIAGSLLSEILLDQVNKYWGTWKQEKTLSISKRNRKINQNNFAPIQEELIAFFRNNYSLNARIIYRTVQKEFGDESPGNLVPKSILPKNVTVFVDFLDKHIAVENIRRIIAFPDECSVTFPKILNPVLHAEKIDIDAMDPKYKFAGINDLYNNFERRFK